MFGDNNLFNPEWTTGNLSAIGPIVQVVGFAAMCLISIGGFFMVILPLMRNVVNGIVVVAPNLCDKIDQAHRNKIGLQSSEGGNQIQMVIGSLGMILLSFFPNFKAMSDFEDGIRDPKSFMIKALPMMCIYIFIGVFVFYGYPAKVAEKFSGAATGVIDMALNNVDPVAWVEKIPTKLAKADLSTNNATDAQGKNVNTLSKSMYSALTSKYSAMSKENRIAVSHEIEEFAYEWLGDIESYSSSPNFKMTVETRVMSYEPTLSSTISGWDDPDIDNANHIHIFQHKLPVSERFNIGVPGGVEGDHAMMVIKFFELSEKPDKATSVKNVATLNYTSGDSLMSGGNGNTKLKLSGNYFSVNQQSGITLNGIKAAKEYITKDSAGNFTIEFVGVEPAAFRTKTGTTTGIFYVTPSNKNNTHPITKINWISSGDAKFEPTDSASFNIWSFGDTPAPKKSTDATTPDAGGRLTN
jgi:hypothetical protein